MHLSATVHANVSDERVVFSWRAPAWEEWCLSPLLTGPRDS
jgi:hypothetical protein